MARAKPDWMTLTVVCATDRDGLSAETAFVLRDMMLAAAPLEFHFLPGSFMAFFSGDEDGLRRGELLAGDIHSRFAALGVHSLGVAVEQGPCNVTQDGQGHFTSNPTGETVERAMRGAVFGREKL